MAAEFIFLLQLLSEDESTEAMWITRDCGE